MHKFRGDTLWLSWIGFLTTQYTIETIENALVKDITKLLLELGTGFAFLENQYHINVGGDDFYIDLLFYNLNLRCYGVIVSYLRHHRAMPEWHTCRAFFRHISQKFLTVALLQPANFCFI